MTVAIWIIAIIEVIRMIQNCIQIWQMWKHNGMSQMDRVTDAFVESLSNTDKVIVESVLKKFEESQQYKSKVNYEDRII